MSYYDKFKDKNHMSLLGRERNKIDNNTAKKYFSRQKSNNEIDG